MNRTATILHMESHILAMMISVPTEKGKAMRLIDADEITYERAHLIYPDGSECLGYRAVASSVVINSAPTVDAVPVRHGFWASSIDGTHFCSECGRDALHYQFDDLCFREELTDFCPRCGAFLDLEYGDAND